MNRLPQSKFVSAWRNISPLFAVTCVTALLLPGCDRVESIVDDVKSQVSDSTEETPAAEPPAQPAAPVTPPPAQPVEPKGPTPAEILASFQQMKPNQISDGALAQLASAPEAAGAITDLDLSANSNVTDAGLGYLAALKNLSSLKLDRMLKIGPTGLTSLGKVQSLTDISLVSTQGVNDSVIASFASIPHLRNLDLTGTAITPAVAPSLANLRELTDLSLAQTPVNDATISTLTTLPIRSLDLLKTRITSESIPLLLGMQTLEELNVAFTSIKGAAFKGAARSNLKSLNVGETAFGLDGFQAIRGMKSLEELNVYKAGLLQHKSANVFKSLPKLRNVNAGYNGLTNEGVQVFFSGHRTLEVLNLRNNKGISDQGLALLISNRNLKELDISGTSCTPGGAQALKQKLPECKIFPYE